MIFLLKGNRAHEKLTSGAEVRQGVGIRRAWLFEAYRAASLLLATPQIVSHGVRSTGPRSVLPRRFTGFVGTF